MYVEPAFAAVIAAYCTKTFRAVNDYVTSLCQYYLLCTARLPAKATRQHKSYHLVACTAFFSSFYVIVTFSASFHSAQYLRSTRLSRWHKWFKNWNLVQAKAGSWFVKRTIVLYVYSLQMRRWYKRACVLGDSTLLHTREMREKLCTYTKNVVSFRLLPPTLLFNFNVRDLTQMGRKYAERHVVNCAFFFLFYFLNICCYELLNGSYRSTTVYLYFLPPELLEIIIVGTNTRFVRWKG